MTGAKKILVVDDHPVVREGLRRLFAKASDLTIGREASSIAEAIAAVEQEMCDLAVVDISIKGRSGIDLIKEFRSRKLKFPILVLSVHDDVTYVQRALSAGAQGYVLKQDAPKTLMDAVRNVLKGGVYVSEPLSAQLLSRFVGKSPKDAHKDPIERLSDRELEVLEFIGRGMGTAQIAQTLNLSMDTIETYKSRIKQKLDIKLAPELAAFAAKWVARKDI